MLPTRSERYQLASWPVTPLNREVWNTVMADLDLRLRDRETLEATFQDLIAQGTQSSLDYIQISVGPQIALLQETIAEAQEQIDAIFVGGNAPNALKLGGQLPSYYASAAALADGLSGKVSGTLLTETLLALLDDAPAGLDTLGKLAAALGDDPDFGDTLQEKLDLLAKQFNLVDAKPSIADADLLSVADSNDGWKQKKLTLANLVTSLFRTTRTIVNAQFAAATFKLFNAAGTPRALTFDVAALTADRKIVMPNADVSFAEYVRKGSSGELTLSNVQFDVTSIPTDAKQITIKLEEVSTSAGGIPLAILLGTSSAFEATGYKISSAGRSTTGTSTSSVTTDIRIPPYSSSAGPYSGMIVMTRVAATNQWLISGSVKNADAAGAVGDVVGFKSLAGLLTRIRLTTSTGAPTLSGSLEIEWER